ncbi:MAG: hypothetical protein WAW06_05095, partial [bacterium]
MKRVLLFALPALAVIGVGLTVLGIVQVRSVKEKLMDDLMRKARNVAESIEFSAHDVLASADADGARRLVESFQKRERLQGCILYDRDLNVMAVTERIAGWQERDTTALAASIETKLARGSLDGIDGYSIYRYVLPVLDEGNEALGLVEVIYDTSYLHSVLAGLWRRISYTLIAIASLILLVSIVVERQTYVLPLRRVTAWFGHFQKGEIDGLSPFNAKGELGKLVSEVEQVALSLRVSRRAAAEEAHARLQQEELWTEAKLRDLVKARLGQNSLVVVSNREPYMHVIDEKDGSIKCLRPASGVVTAIDPILRA